MARDLAEAAKHLEAVWIEREREQRKKTGMLDDSGNALSGTLESEATKRCRLDLQYEFGLTMQVGPGPMTAAEAQEFLKQELK